MDDPGSRQRIALNQPQELLPGDVARPRPPRQPFAPNPPRPMDHGGHAWIVAGNAEVGEVPLQHSTEPTMLLSDRPRPHEAALLVDRLERPHQTIFGGPLPHRRFARPRLAPDVEKAEERKGRGQRTDFLETQSRGFSTRCLRFKWCVTAPACKARFRLVANLSREGVEPSEFHRKVSVLYIIGLPPFPDLSWRERKTHARMPAKRKAAGGLARTQTQVQLNANQIVRRDHRLTAGCYLI
jgi:hypothetical protein